jgi:hypothetical protein
MNNNTEGHHLSDTLQNSYKDTDFIGNHQTLCDEDTIDLFDQLHEEAITDSSIKPIQNPNDREEEASVQPAQPTPPQPPRNNRRYEFDEFDDEFNDGYDDEDDEEEEEEQPSSVSSVPLVPLVPPRNTEQKITEENVLAEFHPTSENSDSFSIGCLHIEEANKTIEEACSMPIPEPLWEHLWNEGELACCFASTNVGKSILATQIGERLAKVYRVLYCDFELSKMQFAIRYSTKENGKIHWHEFPQNFYRAELDPEGLAEDREEGILKDMEEEIIRDKIDILIVDNLTWLCNDSDKGSAAGWIMQNLVGLKKTYNLSILVLAHTPKRLMTAPLSLNDLAGSHKIGDFFDSIWAIGCSVQGKSVRYIKQLKYRNGEITYDSENVLTATIVKDDYFTQFIFGNTDWESNHLPTVDSGNDKLALALQAKKLQEEGKTVRDIATILNTSSTTVFRWLQKTNTFVPPRNTEQTEQTEQAEQAEQQKQPKEDEELPF